MKRLSILGFIFILFILSGLVLLLRQKLRRALQKGPRVCEDLGYDLPRQLRQVLHRSFHRDEIQVAQREAGLGVATRQQEPMAVWLVGPSAAGKSFMAREVAMDLGISPMNQGSTDAVLVDGHTFRSAHGGYQAVVAEGYKLQCVWRQAYPALRQQLQKQKHRLLQEAARRKLNVVIPHTCYLLSECAAWLRSLHRHGYKNHVVMVLGDRSVVESRGIARAQLSGKRYAREEWEATVSSGFEMIALATGYAELVWTTPRTRWIVKKGKPSDVLSEASERGWFL
ncbi:unnamed protein product [Durusdinium trenchii]|uniref:Zeta_toxin domain-containing protein n=2 Tax=Durusdinium trenchii TaxID=1381693 RepID=A0ABP0LUH3_9DINO